MHLHVVRRDEHLAHAGDERLGRIARRDVPVQRPRNLLGGTPRRPGRELSVPVAAQELQRHLEVDARGSRRPGDVPPGDARPQLVEHAPGRLGPLQHEQQLCERPVKQPAHLAGGLRVRPRVEAPELVPEEVGKLGEEAVEHAVDVDAHALLGEVVVREELVVEAVGEGRGEGGREGSGD